MKSSSLFHPLIASSLALLLNNLNAQDITLNQNETKLERGDFSLDGILTLNGGNLFEVGGKLTLQNTSPITINAGKNIIAAGEVDFGSFASSGKLFNFASSNTTNQEIQLIIQDATKSFTLTNSNLFGSANGITTLSFNGKVALGDQTTKVNITSSSNASNHLQFNSVATIDTTKLESTGSHNILSFDSNASENDPSTLSIDTITASSGANFIAKGLLTQFDTTSDTAKKEGIKLNSILFDAGGNLQSSQIDALMGNAYSAYIDTLTTTSISASNTNGSAGANYINISGKIVNSGNIFATGGGKNYISAQTLSASSLSTQSGGENIIFLNGDVRSTASTLTTISANNGTNTITLLAKTQLNVTSNITSQNSGRNQFKMGGNSILNLQGTTHTLNSLSIQTNGNVTIQGKTASIDILSMEEDSALTLKNSNSTISNLDTIASNSTLMIDGSSGRATTSITQAFTQNDLTFGFNARGKRYEAELTLASGDNSFKDITFADTSTSGAKLLLSLGTTTITDFTRINSQKEIVFDLAQNANLTLSKTLENYGKISLDLKGGNTITTNISTNLSATTSINLDNPTSSPITATLIGNLTKNAEGVNTIDFQANNTTLKLQGATTQISSIVGADTHSSELMLDATSSAESIVEAKIFSALSGSALTLNLNGNMDHLASFFLLSSGNTLKALTLGASQSTSDDNLLVLEQGLTSIINPTNIDSGKALDILLRNSTSTLNNTITNNGSLTITFNGLATDTQKSTLQGSVTTTIAKTGTDVISTLKIGANATGVITGDLTQSNGGKNNILFATNNLGKTNSIILQGETNQIDKISWNKLGQTSSILSLDAANQDNSTSIQQSIVGDTLLGGRLIVDFSNTSTHSATLTLNSGNNQLKSITFGTSSQKNILSLTQGKTTISEAIAVIDNQSSIANGQSLTIELNGDSSLIFPTINNKSVLGSDGGGIWIKFAGGTGTSNSLAGNINTGSGDIQGMTTLTITNQSTGIVKGNISTTSISSTNVKFADSGTLKLQGNKNQLTSVSATTSGILSLDGSNSDSGVNTHVINPITNNNVTLNFNGVQNKESTLTLGYKGNQLKAITLGDGGSATTENKLILSQGNTSINDQVSIGSKQALTFDLGNTVNLTLIDNLTNAGNTTFNFNNATLTSTITTNGTNAITDIKVLGNSTGTITGGITTTSGATNVSFTNGGTLKLQGSQNQLTNVSATTSGILSLDGASNANGVSSSVANTIIGENITLNFNGKSDTKKAELTLTNGGNSIKSLTLRDGSNATIGNKLILSQDETTINDPINIASGQSLIVEFNNDSSLIVPSITNASPIGTQGGGLLLEFKGGSGKTNTLTSNITTGGAVQGEDGETTLAVYNQTTAIIKGNISTKTGSTTNVAFSTIGTLKLQGSQNIISYVAGGSGILSLDAYNSNDNVAATITQAIEHNTIEINLNGTKNQKAEITLDAKNNALKSITLGDAQNTTSTNNHLILSSGETNILNSLIINNSQALTIDLGNTTNFILSAPQASTAGTLNNSGTLELNFKNGSSTLTGDIATKSNATTTINLQGNSSSTATLIGNITTQGGGKFTLNAYAETSTFQYDNAQHNAKLEFSAGTHIINLQTQNSKLYWKKHNGSNYTETDIFTTGGKTQINFNANATFVTCSQTSGGSTEINIANGKSGVIEGDIITSNGYTILNFSEGTEATTLTLNGANKTLSTSGGTSIINFKGDQGIFDGIIETSGSGTLDINVESGKLGKIVQNINNSATTNLILSDSNNSTKRTQLIIEKDITTNTSAKTNLTFKGSNSALILKGSNNTISSVSSISGNNNIISLSEGEAHDTRTEGNDRRKLTIQNITQDSNPLTLISQTTATQADTFIINGSTTRNTQQPNTHSLGIVVANGVKLSDIGKSGEILVASVKNASGTTPSIVFGTTSQVVSGFTTATATFDTKQTDENGGDTNQNYTSYFIKSMQNAQVIAAEQEITATAFTLNYDLYMANFNSLNKRMGELRENAHSQGVWARVFNGALSNDFGLSTKSNYTTIQAGYDYAFGSEGANNYLGFALSYALSTSTSEHAFDDKGQKRSIDSIYSNAFELALYNSYVSDEGWYNDTIAKFSYLMSDFKINNITNPSNVTSTTNDAKNFALTLSDEAGYKFTLGESKEWGITPQIELGFGYFSQSDFKQTLENLSAFLQSNSDFLLTLRTRIGSSFSYDFNASLYLGAFYEYDYVSGGEITFRTDQITQDTQNNLSNLQSDGRVVLNAGVNMSVKDNTRIYFDFEKSFLGKINTDYQVNFGVRYSFGESDGYTPLPAPLPQEEQDKKVAPLKIEQTSKPL